MSMNFPHWGARLTSRQNTPDHLQFSPLTPAMIDHIRSRAAASAERNAPQIEMRLEAPTSWPPIKDWQD